MQVQHAPAPPLLYSPHPQRPAPAPLPHCPPTTHVRRWHYEMAQINFVLRALVRVMYGTALLPGTRQQALASFARAAELAPGRLIHK